METKHGEPREGASCRSPHTRQRDNRVLRECCPFSLGVGCSLDVTRTILTSMALYGPIIRSHLWQTTNMALALHAEGSLAVNLSGSEERCRYRDGNSSPWSLPMPHHEVSSLRGSNMLLQWNRNKFTLPSLLASRGYSADQWQAFPREDRSEARSW